VENHRAANKGGAPQDGGQVFKAVRAKPAQEAQRKGEAASRNAPPGRNLRLLGTGQRPEDRSDPVGNRRKNALANRARPTTKKTRKSGIRGGADRTRGAKYQQELLAERLRKALRNDLSRVVARQSRWESPSRLSRYNDLPPEHAAGLEAVSFLTLQTSPGKAQAWIAVPASGTPDDDRDFRRRVKKAARSDLMASGSVRLAGSLNFKPKYAPDFPRVTITHAAPGLLTSKGGVSPNRRKFRQAFPRMDDCRIAAEIGPAALDYLGLSILGLKYGKSVTPGPIPLPDRPCSQRQPSKSGKLVVSGTFGGLGLHPL
jgi:hypothetical protein